MKTLFAYKEAYLDVDSSIYKSASDKNRRRYNINEIQAKINKNNKRYYAGWAQALGSDFLTGKKYLGIGMETTTEQITDKKSLYSNPLEIFLSTPSKIEIYKDGKLLNVQNHEAGYVTLDTKNFPTGSYDTLLRIEDQFGNITEKTKYFVKRTSMPPLNHPQYFVNTGYFQEVFEKSKKILPTYSDKLFLQAGGNYRTGFNTYLSENAIFTRGSLYSETGFYYISSRYSLGPKGFFSTQKDMGGGLEFNTRIDKLSLNLRALKNLRKNNPNTTDSRYDPVGTSRYRISSNISYPLFGGSLSYTNNIYRNFNTDVTHVNIIRYQYNWNISQYFRSFLQSVIRYNADETTFLINFSIRYMGKNISISTNNRRNYAKAKGQKRTYTNVYGVNTNWNKQNKDKKYAASLDLTKQHDKDRVSTGFSYQDNYLSIRPRLNYARVEGKPTHTRTLNLATGFVLSGKDFTLTNTRRSKQGILITVNTSSQVDGKFEIYLNGRAAQVISGNSPIFVRTQPYKTYKIAIASQSEERFEMKEKMKIATIYPGNVAKAEFNAYQIYALISKLVDEKGQPIPGAKFEGGRFYDQTDNSGDFQIDTRADQKELIFKKESGEKCVASLPNQKIESGFMEIPKLVCRPIYSEY